MHKLALTCLFATTSVLLFRECVPLPVHNQHYVFDIDFDEDFQQPGGVHHRVARRTGRGISLDTWACDTVIPLPDDVRAEFPLHAFYQKYTHAYGIPIISSSVSRDAALIRACYTVRFLLADRKDIRDAMFDQYGRVGVIAQTEKTTQIPEHSYLDSSFYDNRARGLGGIPSVPISTNAEENILCYSVMDDRWFTEDILVHEFAHAIHLISLDRVDPLFSTTLGNIYTMAKEENLFPNTYAISKSTEYFAEAVQSFFNVQTCRDFVDNVHNHICTRHQLMEYDPRLYNLTAKIFPCMNVLVDRCNSDQALAANQELRMNCDVAVTTADTATASSTGETTTTDAGTTKSSTVHITQEVTTMNCDVAVTTADTATASSTGATTTTDAGTTKSSTVHITQEVTTSSSTESVTDGVTPGVTTLNPTETTTENVKQDMNECKEMTAAQECSAKGLICVNRLGGYTCRCPFGEFKTGNMDSCKKGRIYGLTISIVKYKSRLAKFTADLNNSLSVEFLTHQTRIEFLLNEAFGPLPGFGDAVVLSFFNGSIGVEATVTYDPASTVTPADIQHVISVDNPFMGSDYKADLNNTIVQQVCVAGFCYNGGTCEPSVEKYPSICKCPLGFDGDRCEIQTFTVDMTTDHAVPVRSNTIVIAIIVISVIGIVIAMAFLIQRLRGWRGKSDTRSQSPSGVELKGVKYSQGSRAITT